jgi:hypothetical protein
MEKFVASIWFKSRVSHRASGKIVNEAGESLNEMRRDWSAQGRHFGADRHSGAPRSAEPGIHIRQRVGKASERIRDDCGYGFRTWRCAQSAMTVNAV